MTLSPQPQRIVSASGTQSDDISKIERTQDACKRLMAASTEFQKANSQFSAIVVANAEPREGGGSTLTFTTEQFGTYTTAVIELIDAANVLPEKDGLINGDGLLPFVNTAGVFLNACAEFFSAVTAGFGRISKKPRAPVH